MSLVSIQEGFAVQAAATPDAIAISGDGVQWTYRDLDQRADRLAQRLRALGAGPEVPVAVLMQRSPDLVAATLAVLKTGSYYLPLHQAHPLERLQWIIDHAGRPVLLADAAMQARGLPTTRETVVVDTDTDTTADADADQTPAPVVASHPLNLAYMMYTSGSTGQPKGVGTTHRDALGLILDSAWNADHYGRTLMVAPYAFGMSTFELWVPLLHGGRIVLAPPGDLSVETLRRLITEHQITCVHLTAGLFRLVAEEAPRILATVPEVMTGGDTVSPDAVRRVLEACPDTTVRVMYGNTESTLFATTARLGRPYQPTPTVPIGTPMDNMRVYLLDEALNPVEPGEVGEMYLAGVGVARGYTDRPDLTAERFVADPFHGSGERMFRTGDFARRDAEGLLHFAGRADHQIKIRGFRVEPAEVEAALARYPGVAHVVVAARNQEADDKLLVAYVVAAPDLDFAALRAHAAATLPDYMTPTAYVLLDALPLTANGKLDRAALPDPAPEDLADHQAPATRTQEALCAIFADILGRPRVGIDESFFILGGQSLQAMRIILRVERDLGFTTTIAELFDYPTPALLAKYLEGAPRDESV